MHDGPPDAGPGSPTAGDPIGGHRVIEPDAALPGVASRLDPRPDLWDREVRAELTDIVLGAEDHAAIQQQAGGDPARMRAALLEAAAERGGLPTHLHDTALLGRVAARAEGAPPGPAVGDRAVVLPPVAAVPCWLHDVSGWNGGRRIPVAGHAVLAPRTPVVAVGDDLPPEVAVALGLTSHVPGAVERLGISRGTRLVVTGPTDVAGATALLTAARAGARPAGIVTTLQAARLVRTLGPADPVIVAPADTTEGVRAVLETLGGPPDIALVADPDRDLLRLVAALVEWRSGLAAAPSGAPITGDDEPEET